MLNPSFIWYSWRRENWMLCRTILTFSYRLHTSPFHHTLVTLHQTTNNLLPNNNRLSKVASYKGCIMSARLVSKSKGSSRKRKFAFASSPILPSNQTSSSDESIATATSRLKAGSDTDDDDATVEFDFESGSVAFHVKRHKLSMPSSDKSTIIDPAMLTICSDESSFQKKSQSPATTSCSTRLLCQSPLTSPPEKFSLSPSKSPELTPTVSVTVPAIDPLTASEWNVSGFASHGVLKQSLTSSSCKYILPSSKNILPSTHQNVASHPCLFSPCTSTHQLNLSNDKEPFCIDEQNAKEHDLGMQFIDDCYVGSKTGESHVGDRTNRTNDERMDFAESVSQMSFSGDPCIVEHCEDVMGESSIGDSMTSKHLEQNRGKNYEEGVDNMNSANEGKTLIRQLEYSNLTDAEKEIPEIEAIGPEGSECVEEMVPNPDNNTESVKGSKNSTELKPVEDSLMKENAKRTSKFGRLVPRSVALGSQRGNVGPSQLRRAKAARDTAKRGLRHASLQVGKSSSISGNKGKDRMSIKVIEQVNKPKSDSNYTHSEIHDSMASSREKEIVFGTDNECPGSEEPAVATEITESQDSGMEAESDSLFGKVHLEHDPMDFSENKDKNNQAGIEERVEERPSPGPGPFCGPISGPLPELPETYSELQESGLADIDLFPTDEEFGVETIRRRKALFDKEGRDSLLKEATRKLSLKAKKRKRRTSDKGVDGSVIGGGIDDGDDKKQKRVAPNYFVAIQVCNPEIHQALQAVQQTVMAGDEKLKDAMVPIPTLHLTIMVMHLENDEDVERAKLALMECHRLLGPEITRKKLNIWFHGLGHFNNQVMFAKIKDIDGILDTLYGVAETVENCYRRHGIHSTGERGFKPHLTVMKLSRAPSLRKKGVRRIKSELYRAHSTTLFGNQPVSGFQLCSINKPKSEDGYYHKALEVLFNQDVSPIPDPFDMTGTGDVQKEPITEPLSSSIIEEEPKDPITEPDSSCSVTGEAKESITATAGCQAANETQETQEAKEVPKQDSTLYAVHSPNVEGDKPSTSEPT